MKKNNDQTPPNPSRSRKPYRKPQLQVYGDLREVTQSTLLGMTQDSSKGKANKTSP
jgi:hypothetical protein